MRFYDKGEFHLERDHPVFQRESKTGALVLCTSTPASVTILCFCERVSHFP